MALAGKIIKLANGMPAFESISTAWEKPETIRHVWAIESYRFSGYSACGLEDAIGRDATCTNSTVSCYLGDGNYLSGDLLRNNGDQSSKAITVEILPAQRPEARTELRWYQGAWQKHNKARGWIAA